MDRFIVREPRNAIDCPSANHTIVHRASAPRTNNNIMIPQDNMYYGGYASECPSVAREPIPSPYAMHHDGYIGVQQPANMGNYPFHQNQGQQLMSLSGIDPRYLAAYGDNAASFIVTGQHETTRMPISYGSDYENRSFVAPDRNKAFTPQMPKENFKHQVITHTKMNTPMFQNNNIRSEHFGNNIQNPVTPNYDTLNRRVDSSTPTNLNTRFEDNGLKEFSGSNIQKITPNVLTPAKPAPENIPKEEVKSQLLTRSDKYKALYKSGTKAFSGPVEKVLKWHKALQEIGVLVIYEIVAKCVSVRQGDSCSKNLVVRDDNGPAMQVVYYEIDFLLPELKPPCTVRVVGRMMPGTSRLQAFNVRPATGDDVATLPRRAAVAAHHVAKLCKEYGVTNN